MMLALSPPDRECDAAGHELLRNGGEMQSRVETERSVAFAKTNTALAIAPAATIVAPTAKAT
jgi:hypothetical protein